MPIIRIQAVMPFFTNLPKDVITNTWWFFSDGVTPFESAAGYLAERLHDFYTSAYAGGIASYINKTLVHYDCYDQSTPPPRVPFRVDIPLSTPPAVSAVIPTEVAAVLSFQAVPISGLPQARRRGRVYLGGLISPYISGSTASAFPIFTTTFLNSVTSAAQVNLLDLETVGLDWVVWSQVGSSSAPVASGWVDNSPDTQRRRSVEATARTLWP